MYLLSICIPTYNRASLLRVTLENLYGQLNDQGFLNCVEIVVSDNASTDNTSAVVDGFRDRLNISYSKNKENLGYEVNFSRALSLSSGRFYTYLADDDALIIETLVEIIKFMDANEAVSAVYAPWRIINLANSSDHGLFYQVDDLKLFKKGSSVDLLSYLLDRHVFPEICVYRRSAVSVRFPMEKIACWAFSHIGIAIEKGDVVFWPNEYYISIIQHFSDESRSHAGNWEVMNSWDSYRGGLEWLLHRARSKMNEPASDFLIRIDKFIAARMSVGLRLRLQSGTGSAVENYYLACRIIGLSGTCGFSIDDLRMMAVLEYIAKLPSRHGLDTPLIVLGDYDETVLCELLRLCESGVLIVPASEDLFLLKPSVVLYGTGKISPDIMIELSDRNMVFVLDDDVEKIFC